MAQEKPTPRDELSRDNLRKAVVRFIMLAVEYERHMEAKKRDRWGRPGDELMRSELDSLLARMTKQVHAKHKDRERRFRAYVWATLVDDLADWFREFKDDAAKLDRARGEIATWLCEEFRRRSGKAIDKEQLKHVDEVVAKMTHREVRGEIPKKTVQGARQGAFTILGRLAGESASKCQQRYNEVRNDDFPLSRARLIAAAKRAGAAGTEIPAMLDDKRETVLSYVATALEIDLPIEILEEHVGESHVFGTSHPERLVKRLRHLFKERDRKPKKPRR